MKTYYRNIERGFANEYVVGVARDDAERKAYESSGWERTTRKDALRYARYRGDAATTAHVGYRLGDPNLERSVVVRDEWLAAI